MPARCHQGDACWNATPLSPWPCPQVRKWHYEVPGYKWVDSTSPSHPRYPTGPEVQAYLQAYARDAGLLPLVKFEVEVQSLTPRPGQTAAGAHPGANGWELEWKDAKG